MTCKTLGIKIHLKKMQQADMTVCFAIAIFASMLLNIFHKIDQVDHVLFTKINGEWHNSFFDAFFPFTRESMFWAPLYFFLALFVIINFKKYGWWWVLFLVLNVALSDFVNSSLVKDIFFRLRPCHDASLADNLRFLVRYCPESSSFTSSHAANHFAAAMFIFATLRHKVDNRWLALIFLWAFIPCYAQVYVGVHFPTDILGGIFVGLVLGYTVAYIFNRLILKKAE